MDNYYDNGLHCKNVQNIINKVPSSIVRYGISIVALILVLLSTAVFYITYSESIKFKATITSTNNHDIYAVGLIPYQHIHRIENGMTGKIKFKNQSNNQLISTKITIKEIEDNLVNIDGSRYFTVKLSFAEKEEIPFETDISGKAVIVISNNTIISLFSHMNSSSEKEE